MQSVREYHRELRMDFESEMEEDIKSIQLYIAVICPLQNYAVSGSILLKLQTTYSTVTMIKRMRPKKKYMCHQLTHSLYSFWSMIY